MTTNIKHSTISNERYTPYDIAESARVILGKIDLDPASSEIANTIIKAEKIYTKQDDGFKRRWHGNIYLNPPGKTKEDPRSGTEWLIKLFNEYFEGNVNSAIYMGFSVEQLTKTVWTFMFPLCFTHSSATAESVNGSGRIKFINQDLSVAASPSHSNFIMYLPPNNVIPEVREYKIKQFCTEFAKYGVTGKFNVY